MWRTILSVIAGVVAWVLIVSVLNWGLRLWLPGYHAAEPAMQFTLTMMIGRLAIATLTSLATGAIIRLIAPQSNWAPWIVGLIGLIAFIPDHIHVWTHFPIWYHAYFLLTLAPWIWLGSLLSRAKSTHPQRI
jgi:hypothetical protein